MKVVETVSDLITVIISVTAVAKRLNEVRNRYNNVALNTTLIASQTSGFVMSWRARTNFEQLSIIRTALQVIVKWRFTDQTSSRLFRQLDDDLTVFLNCCVILITVVDFKLSEINYTSDMKQKIKHLWLKNTLKKYISNLEDQMRALQLLLTIFQWYILMIEHEDDED